MITRLGIRGFKSLGFHGLDLPLAPITLILGENSIGKSSIFQALLALQQSWTKFAYIDQFSPVGPAVDLGRFCNLQHRFGDFVCKDTVLRIERGDRALELRWHDPKASPIEATNIVEPPPGWPRGWAKLGESDLGQLGQIKLNDEFHFIPRWNQENHGLSLTLEGACVNRWLEKFPDDVFAPALSQMPVFTWDIDVASERDFELSVSPADPLPDDFNQEAFKGLQERCSLRSVGDLGTLWGSAHSALSFSGAFRRAVSELSHIGGLRERGQRIYEVVHSDRPWAVGPTGERIADILASSPATVDGSNLLLNLTNQLLAAARVNYKLELLDYNSKANIRELVLEEMNEGRTQGNRVGIPDVGTGISQLLPIAVQLAAFLEPRRFNSPTLLIEQPETHLHPRLQANLAHMFRFAISKELPEVGAQIPQIIVETHSEHLVMGLCLLIKRKQLEPSDVSLIKLTRDTETQEVVAKRVMVDRQGQFIDPWPGDFFPERDQLVYEQDSW